MTLFQENSGSPINTSVNNEPLIGVNGFSPPLTTINKLDAQAPNVNNFFSDSDDILPTSQQIDGAQILSEQQAHLQRSQQEINTFREQKLQELYQSFQQPRTLPPTSPNATIPDTRQKIADLQNLFSQKQDTLSRTGRLTQSVALSTTKRRITF